MSTTVSFSSTSQLAKKVAELSSSPIPPSFPPSSFRLLRRLLPWNARRGYSMHLSNRVSHFSRKFFISANRPRSLSPTHTTRPLSSFNRPLPGLYLLHPPRLETRQHPPSLLLRLPKTRQSHPFVRLFLLFLFLFLLRARRERLNSTSVSFLSPLLSHSHRRHHPSSLSLHRGMHSNSFFPRWTSSLDLPNLKLVGLSSREGRWTSFRKPVGRDPLSDP